MNCSCKPHCLPCVPPLTQARLKGHPNVLRLHAVAFAGPRGGETDGFFLLDFCPGNLLDLLARHNYLLEQATALHIFGCVARAVAHMHAQSPPMAHRWGEGRRLRRGRGATACSSAHWPHVVQLGLRVIGTHLTQEKRTVEGSALCCACMVNLSSCRT